MLWIVKLVTPAAYPPTLSDRQLYEQAGNRRCAAVPLRTGQLVTGTGPLHAERAALADAGRSACGRCDDPDGPRHAGHSGVIAASNTRAPGLVAYPRQLRHCEAIASLATLIIAVILSLNWLR